VGAALRHLDGHGSEPGAVAIAQALARFLVSRCDSHHAGWRAVRQVVVDSPADAPWEKCARRAVPRVAEDLISLAEGHGRTPLARAQHIAAQRRAEEIAVHVDQAALHIVHAGSGGDIVFHAVGLKGTGLFKYRVHVADEQHALAAFPRFGAGMVGYQNAGALHLLHLNPLHLEAEIAKLRLHDLGHRAHALKIVCAAVNTHQLREQDVRRLLVGVDIGNDCFFLGSKRRRILRERDNAEPCSEQEEDGGP
jgi:hypothetical protein